MLNNLPAFFKTLDRTKLISALIDGTGLPAQFQGEILGMPDVGTQISTTGKKDEQNIIEALDFCQKVLTYNIAPEARELNILDFGCGWGRISRVFLTATSAVNITGVDVRLDALELGRKLTPKIRFELINPRPTIVSYADDRFDLIVAYSVFSHLSEDVALSWIEEFARLLSPGGVLCVTTRPRAHLVNAKRNAENLSSNSVFGHQRQYATMLDNFDAAISKYDSGGFVYVPTGGGGVLRPDFYGEAIIPRAYVEKHWVEYFELVDWVDKFSEIGSQPIIVLRRSGSSFY